jgi:hypothetical protein
MSEDEADLLSSPQPGPVNSQTPEPIEIEEELEIHPSQDEQLIADVDRIKFNKN